MRVRSYNPGRDTRWGHRRFNPPGPLTDEDLRPETGPDLLPEEKAQIRAAITRGFSTGAFGEFPFPTSRYDAGYISGALTLTRPLSRALKAIWPGESPEQIRARLVAVADVIPEVTRLVAWFEEVV